MSPSTSQKPSESQKPSPLASHHPSSSPSESQTPTIGKLLLFRSSGTSWNYLRFDYHVEHNEAQSGVLLQSDCTTPITDTNIILAHQYRWVINSNPLLDMTRAYYLLDPATIYNSVIFDSTTSTIQVCYIASLTNHPNVVDTRIITYTVPPKGGCNVLLHCIPNNKHIYKSRHKLIVQLFRSLLWDIRRPSYRHLWRVTFWLSSRRRVHYPHFVGRLRFQNPRKVHYDRF